MMTREWRWRIRRWCETMPGMFYRPEAEVPLAACRSERQLSPEEARDLPFEAVEPGWRWGRKWEYCWFKGRLRIPETLAGERVVLKVTPGCDCVVFLDGRVAGGNSVAGYDGHQDIGGRPVTLTRCAAGGESFEILLEGYAGHGLRTMGGGPCPHGVDSIPEPPETAQVFTASTFGVWEEELFQLWLDATALFELHDVLGDAESLRAADLAAGLQEMTLAVDLELPRREMLAGVRAGRALLRPLLEAVNGSTSPAMYCFGHSHLDLAWLWPVEETVRKCARTFGSQLALMEEYPFYRFLQSQAHAYRFVKEHYPELYGRIQAAVKRGQWIVEGALWVEPDMNLASGESIVRQILHGKRFFREEFGVDSTLLWLPDVFGYSGALPQIMKETGITAFSTQKLFCCENADGVPPPRNLFEWVGIDGSGVTTYLHNVYSSGVNPAAVMERWNERVQKDASHRARLMPYGHGDGGGGPTREHLEYLAREGDLEGLPRCRSVHPGDFFAECLAGDLPQWRGELYFQDHRGTLTSQARIKCLNRRGEIALRQAEFWDAAVAVRSGGTVSPETLDEYWKLLMFNQFHDILPGTSIRRVCERAGRELGEVVRAAAALVCQAQARLAAPAAGVWTAFNSLSWRRDALAVLPPETAGIAGTPCQEIEGKVYTLLEGLPSCGWKSFRSGAPAPVKNPVVCRDNVIENEFFRLEFNQRGEIGSFRDRASGREFLAGPGNRFHLYRDVPSHCDAWNIDSMYQCQEIALTRPVKTRLIAAGPLVAMVEFEHEIASSRLVQRLVVRAGSRRIDFITRVEWQERHKLLKVAFPLNLVAETSLQEIQFGHLERPMHANLPYDANRYEVCQHHWCAVCESGRGAAVLNDCKYGVSARRDTIALTLLKAGLAPDRDADRGEHEFTYAFMAWEGAFAASGVVAEGYDLNEPAALAPGDGGTASLFRLSHPAVVLETVKPAEDGSGDLILRLYESMRSAVDCELAIGFAHAGAVCCDMLEKPRPDAPAVSGDRLALSFRAFEIKTLRIYKRKEC